jgi:4-diphosphocytidyl-2-C-methyl-D-erythritol kinase
MIAVDSRTAAVRVRALAKINLWLRVHGLRRDGFHELRTLFQSIALHDTLVFREAPGPFRIVCSDGACPTDEHNIVWRAAAVVWAARKQPGPPRDVTVRLSKRIPVEAGLGGGSSDAAATILALTALWRVPLSRRRARHAAVSLGADVPFFLRGGISIAAGRGDRLVGRADLPLAHVVLAIPPFGVSTKRAYEWWDRAHQMREGLRGGRALEQVAPWRGAPRRAGGLTCEAGNDLEAPVVARHPEIGTLIAALGEAGARDAGMSGSGSAVFGLFDREVEARRAARHLARPGLRVLVTRTVDRARYAQLTVPRFVRR